MAWHFSSERPIYIQLLEQLQQRIVTGVYPPGSRMDSVRELAGEASVNPNTMQRALAQLEQQELVYSRRTAGRFVTEDPERISALRDSLARDKAENFFREMKDLGFSRADALRLLAKAEPTLTEKEEENT